MGSSGCAASNSDGVGPGGRASVPPAPASTPGDAKAAHFHGPAAPGANAGVEVPIPVGPSPMKGTATLTDAQMADFLGGKIYVNIHTEANKGGEIRGQLTAM